MLINFLPRVFIRTASTVIDPLTISTTTSINTALTNWCEIPNVLEKPSITTKEGKTANLANGITIIGNSIIEVSLQNINVSRTLYNTLSAYSKVDIMFIDNDSDENNAIVLYNFNFKVYVKYESNDFVTFNINLSKTTSNELGALNYIELDRTYATVENKYEDPIEFGYTNELNKSVKRIIESDEIAKISIYNNSLTKITTTFIIDGASENVNYNNVLGGAGRTLSYTISDTKEITGPGIA